MGLAQVPVVPDTCGQGQEPLGDAGEQALGGAAAMAFQGELVFEGVEDGFDALADPAQAANSVWLVAAVGAQEPGPELTDGGLEATAGKALVADDV